MRPKMKDIRNYHANLLNVGLGIQSTAAALMCIHGDLPRPDAFIFADTGWEREGTYENLKLLKPIAEDARIPFHVVSAGNIRDEQLKPEVGRVELPYFCDPSRFETVEGKRTLLIKDVTKAYRKMLKSMETQGELFGGFTLNDYLEPALTDFDRKVEDGEITEGWMEMSVTRLGRQCTEKYKIAPVNKHCRLNYGAHHTTPVGTWLGISTDEWTRMAVSSVKAFELLYPLIDYGYSRSDCESYIIDHNYPVPVKSACIGCPFHSNPTWNDLNDAEIEDVSDFEEGVNKIIQNDPKLKDLPYFANGVRVHGSMTSIRERPFKKAKPDEETERDTVCGAAGCFL